MNFLTLHPSRSIIELRGSDKLNFLQGLVTQDVSLVDRQNIVYVLSLSPQGRFQCEMFIIKYNDDIWFLDVESEQVEAIIKKLNLYKLRSEITLKISDTWKVGVSANETEDKFCFIDPRKESLGYRFYKDSNINYSESDYINYEFLRINLLVPEGSKDLIIDKSIPLEWNMENLNAISWSKGCYIGQELTARTKHLGTIRKKIFSISFESSVDFEKGLSITQENQIVGSIGTAKGKVALALINEKCDSNKEVYINGIKGCLF